MEYLAKQVSATPALDQFEAFHAQFAQEDKFGTLAQSDSKEDYLVTGDHLAAWPLTTSQD